MKNLLGWLALVIAVMWVVKTPPGPPPWPQDRPRRWPPSPAPCDPPHPARQKDTAAMIHPHVTLLPNGT